MNVAVYTAVNLFGCLSYIYVKGILHSVLDEEIKLTLDPEVESAKEDSVDEDDQKLVIKEEIDEEDETDRNVSQASSCDYNLSQFRDEPKFAEEGEENSEDDAPLVSGHFQFCPPLCY